VKFEDAQVDANTIEVSDKGLVNFSNNVADLGNGSKLILKGNAEAKFTGNAGTVDQGIEIEGDA